MACKSVTYEKDLMEWLQDPAHAAEYINAAIADGDREVFLLALRDLAKARGGMSAVAEQAKISRTSLQNWAINGWLRRRLRRSDAL